MRLRLACSLRLKGSEESTQAVADSGTTATATGLGTARLAARLTADQSSTGWPLTSFHERTASSVKRPGFPSMMPGPNMDSSRKIWRRTASSPVGLPEAATCGAAGLMGVSPSPSTSLRGMALMTGRSCGGAGAGGVGTVGVGAGLSGGVGWVSSGVTGTARMIGGSCPRAGRQMARRQRRGRVSGRGMAGRRCRQGSGSDPRWRIAPLRCGTCNTEPVGRRVPDWRVVGNFGVGDFSGVRGFRWEKVFRALADADEEEHERDFDEDADDGCEGCAGVEAEEHDGGGDGDFEVV